MTSLCANTFFATASAVIAAGGRPVLMDTDLATLSTTAAEVERRLTPNTANYYKYVVMLQEGAARVPLKTRLKEEFGDRVIAALETIYRT
jgi:hypothetical protein